MVSTTKIMSLNVDKTPLKIIIKRSSSLTRENIKLLYGDIGVDIFDGKKNITILPEYKKPQSFLSKAKKWLSGKNKLDYEEKDSVRDLVLKYAYNKKSGTYDEIEEKFGKEGLREADIYKVMGYFTTN